MHAGTRGGAAHGVDVRRRRIRERGLAAQGVRSRAERSACQNTSSRGKVARGGTTASNSDADRASVLSAHMAEKRGFSRVPPTTRTRAGHAICFGSVPGK